MVKPLKTKSKRRLGSAQNVKLIGALKKLIFFSLPYVLCLAAVGTLFGSVVAYAVNSATFQLQEVKVLNMGSITPQQAFQFCELTPGENLITLNLAGVQQVIKRKHPEFKEVQVRRVLPNRVEVLLRRRTPVAQIAYAPRFVQVDKDLVLLPGSSKVPFKQLTIIEGVPLPDRGLYVGVTLNDPLSQKALRLTSEIHRSGILKKHQLTRIDVRDPRNISLYVDGDIEIRIGSSHIIERLKILDQTLKTIDLDPSKIRYIDLRFDDVVIGPR